MVSLHYNRGKCDGAEPLHQRALAIWEEVLGFKYPNIVLPTNNLASLYVRQGKCNNAEPRSSGCWRSGGRVRQNHTHMALSLASMAYLYSKQGKCDDAEPLYQQAVTRCWDKSTQTWFYTPRIWLVWVMKKAIISSHKSQHIVLCHSHITYLFLIIVLNNFVVCTIVWLEIN